MNTAIPQASLQIVSDELAVTLHDARVVLEQFAEGDGGPQSLERVGALLHTARGVLRMTETHGASLLAEEMEQTCAHLSRLKRRDAGADEPLEALMRAAVQLPAYVERVLNGGRDIPLVLLPLLNDLRAARGRPLLSESTLLLLNAGAGQGMRTGPSSPQGNGEDIARLCLELRPRFQLALLGWIRGEDAEANLRQMSGVAQRLEGAASLQETHQLWWVAAGVLEALLDKGLETSVSLKRLIGQVDREIKRLRTLGEAQFARAAPVELVNNLLYYVARAKSSGERTTAIRSAFNLSGLMPGDAQVEQARQSMSGPSIKLMQTVAGAIREDLARVKDVLDIFVRTGMERVEELGPQLDLLKKIGDTLGVLGLGDLREIVQTRREELQDLIAGARRPEETTLVSIAAALLGVEDRLEGDLIGMITARTDEPTVVSLDVPAERDPDLNQVTPAVVRECLVNLARVKEAVAQATDRRGESGATDLVPELLRGITAGLMMLGKERAAGVVESLQKAIAALLREGGQVGQGGRSSPGSDTDHRMDRLADATVSLEYYLETLQAGRSDPNYMLDNAERCLAGLVSSEPRQPAGFLEGLDSLDEAATVAATPPEYEATQVLSRPPATSEPEEPTLVFSGGRERLDPELLELFIEEARDEIANIGRDFPAWERDDADGNALASLRRSFHTLKGSGRMVGADRIGECCWHVERVFNRLIDGTLRRNPQMLALLQRAISVVPELLEELETGAPPRADLRALIAELRSLTEAPRQAEEIVETAGEPAVEPEYAAAPGTQPAETTPAEQPQAEPAPAPAAITAPPVGMDPVLLDIFTREVGGHLAVLRKFAAACTQPGAAYAVPESLYRSCHTLNGSMAMARVEIGLPLGEALNRLVSLAYNRPARLPPGTIATLRDTAARIEALLAYLGEPWRPIPQTADLEQRLRDHAAALDQPQEEPLERTGDVPVDELAAGEDGVGQDESSIVVEELALPEVIELTGEISVADAANFAGTETASETLAGLHAESVDLDLTPPGETVSPPEPDFQLPAAEREPDWLVGELDAGDSREPDLLLSLEDTGGDTSLPGGDFESAPVPGSDGGMPAEESVFDDSLSAHFEAEPDFLAEPESAGEEPTVFPDEFDVEEVIDADAAAALLGTQEEPPAVSEPSARPFVAEPEAMATPPEAAAGARPDTTGGQRFPADERAEAAHPALPFDPEIAAIFAEEAAELLEAADGAMAQLADGAPVERPLADLQRYLHTLKGGARMSGLTVMGDFSHELETLLIRVSEGLAPRSPAIDELLQASLDQLHRLREGALSGEQQTLPAQLAARLQAVLRGEVAPEPVAAESQAIVPSPEVTTEAAPEPVAEGDVEPEAPAPSPQAIAPEPAAEPEPLPVAPAPEMPVAEFALPAADRIAELARELERPAPPPAPTPAARQETTARTGVPERRESARVDSTLLDHLLNNAGELSIFQSRLSQQVSLIQFNLEELGSTVIRLREQLRKLEMETEAQIRFRHQEEPGLRADFDPLELDRYSTIQQLSRSLAETTTDVNSLKDLLQNMARDAEALLVQQSRTATELQDGLMRTRMVPFQQHAPRLARLVRQTAMEVGKRAELHVQGGGELDRQVLERMLGPFEHMLRNAIVHGIETPAEREAAGKPATGSIFINLQRDGSEAVVELSDDGRGIDVAAVRRKAADLGFIEPGTVVDDEEVMQFILRPGFSTADRLTQAAGRGIGMDVVTSEVARLGGSLRISSVPGRGTTFTIRLPFTLAVTQALIVRVATEIYALPLPTVEGVIRISRGELMARLESPQPSIDYGGETYQFRHLGEYLGLGPSRIPEEQGRVSVILVRAGEYSAALITDEMQDSREVVVKPVGPQLATIRGIAGATILGDGRIAVILDMGILVRSARPTGGTKVPAAEPAPQGPLALVVDDSITMRRVTQRLLERNSFRVVTAKDGLEAISVLQDHRPDIILLDIEMPRMDGYEFAKHVRNNPDTADVPIVMITSRVSEKHKARAIEVGVNDYLGKPYQERGLLAAVRQQLKKA